MTITGSVPIHGHAEGGEAFSLEAVEDVDRLVDLLSRPETDTATLEAEDGSTLDAHVAGAAGYLLYAGNDSFGYSVGDPGTPAVESEVGFPPGSGIPLDRFRTALREFLADGGRAPRSVRWRDPAELP
ncbi:Imm1 family immunity protein [Amycolatopsis sp. cmx-8-4]|uniref:Imm1 family immunity protein n=1 Tax=Amycolatopsis sp. cmx-8-4 TaxID=2790947 RepID=UPI003979A0E5